MADQSSTPIPLSAASTSPAAEVPRVVVVNRYPAGEVGRAAIALLGVLLGAYLLWRIQDVLFLMFVAIIFATAIEPLVNRLRRGPFTRGTGTLVVYTGLILLIGVPLYIAAPSFTAQANQFVEGLPDRLLALRPYVEGVEPRSLREALTTALDRASTSLRYPAPPAENQIVETGAKAAHALIAFLTVFVLAFYWMVERASIKRVLLRTVKAEQAKEVNAVWLEVEEKLGGWVRGQLILMLAVGVLAGMAFVIIGLPNPLILALAAGVLEMIPMLGPFLAFAPAVLVALAIDPTKVLWVVAAALIIQQLEGNVLVPRVLGHTVGVSPLTVLLGILVGSTLYGIPGAFMAVPVAGAIQVILAHTLRAEDPAQAEAHSTGTPRAEAQGLTPPRAKAA